MKKGTWFFLLLETVMFVNPTLGEIFLISGKTKTIHAASRLSDRCAISGEENGEFGILPAKDEERAFMIDQFGLEYPELSLCPYCFERELNLEKK